MDDEKNEVKKRNARTTKKQIEIIMNYLEENKIILTGKIEARDINKIETMWFNLSDLLNSSGKGPIKSVNQWKRVVHELKTNVKKRAREVHVVNIGTGGGPKKLKPLTDIEERMLGLISKVSIEGAPIVEPGLNFTSEVVLVAEELPEEMQEIIQINNLDEVNRNEECEKTTKTQRRKTEIRATKKDFKRIRPRRYETPQPPNINILASNVESQTQAITELACSIRYLGDALCGISSALNKIADKLNA